MGHCDRLSFLRDKALASVHEYRDLQLHADLGQSNPAFLHDTADEEPEVQELLHARVPAPVPVSDHASIQ